MDPVMVPAKFEVHSICSPVPEIIAICILVGGWNIQSWGRGGRRGSGMVHQMLLYWNLFISPWWR